MPDLGLHIKLGPCIGWTAAGSCPGIISTCQRLQTLHSKPGVCNLFGVTANWHQLHGGGTVQQHSGLKGLG